MSIAVAQPPATSVVRDLLALTKPRITFFVILTTADDLYLDSDSASASAIDPIVALIAVIGTALVVSSANALNCWMERELDVHMARTKNRPLPAGRLSAKTALWFGLALGAISVPLLAVMVNPLTGLLAAIALVSYVWIYTPMKQRSPKALLVGSIPGAMPPLMGWTAATGHLEAPGLVLFGILFLWQLPHFLAISVFRQNEYAKAGIKVLPSVRGNAVTKVHAIAYAGALVPMSLMLVPLGIAGSLYLWVMGVGGVLFAALCVSGLRASGGEDNRWARAVFIASIVYLPLLFGALAVDLAS